LIFLLLFGYIFFATKTQKHQIPLKKIDTKLVTVRVEEQGVGMLVSGYLWPVTGYSYQQQETSNKKKMS